jgi:predicted phosphodiesterase
MRVLAIADIHGVTDVYDWLPDAISDNCADALILAGDLLLGGWEEEQSERLYFLCFIKSLSLCFLLWEMTIISNLDLRVE